MKGDKVSYATPLSLQLQPSASWLPARYKILASLFSNHNWLSHRPSCWAQLWDRLSYNSSNDRDIWEIVCGWPHGNLLVAQWRTMFRRGVFRCLCNENYELKFEFVKPRPACAGISNDYQQSCTFKDGHDQVVFTESRSRQFGGALLPCTLSRALIIFSSRVKSPHIF